MKKISLTLMMIACFFVNPISAADSCDGTDKHPCIVQDTVKNPAQVNNWRDNFMLEAAYPGNITGLDMLWMSGSAEPSVAGFNTIKTQIEKNTSSRAKTIIDLDLRQESHGFLNENAITLAVQNDWVNIGKSSSDALADEKAWLQTLRGLKYVTVLTPDEFKAHAFLTGKLVSIQSVASEDQVATSLGMNYVRLTVSDHMAPNADEVDKFITLIKTLPLNAWLHIHCRGGKGRTTTYMVMYDMLKNADAVSANEIIKRQAAVVPHYDLFDVKHDNPELAPFYLKRLQFIKEFYLYARAYQHGYKGLWSDWLKLDKNSLLKIPQS